MKIKILILFFITCTSFADSTYVAIANVFYKHNNDVVFFKTVTKAEKLNLAYTELLAQGIHKDSLWIKNTIYCFWPDLDSAVIYNYYRVGMTNHYDTLTTEWLDSETWRAAFDDLVY